MNNQSVSDRRSLAKLLNISSEQLDYVTITKPDADLRKGRTVITQMDYARVLIIVENIERYEYSVDLWIEYGIKLILRR